MMMGSPRSSCLADAAHPLRRGQRRQRLHAQAAPAAEGLRRVGCGRRRGRARRARDELPDLILLDLGLPLLDGWQVARALKADPRTRAIPIIALSAHAMADDRAQALEAGCEDYDTKPVDLPRLLEKMRGAPAPDGPA